MWAVYDTLCLPEGPLDICADVLQSEKKCIVSFITHSDLRPYLSLASKIDGHDIFHSALNALVFIICAFRYFCDLERLYILLPE